MPDPNRPLLSVVVPVFNQAASIVANLEVIRDRVGNELGDEFEIVVVSDGSIDATENELVARAPNGAFRVFHYDRNLGKGYVRGVISAHQRSLIDTYTAASYLDAKVQQLRRLGQEAMLKADVQ